MLVLAAAVMAYVVLGGEDAEPAVTQAEAGPAAASACAQVQRFEELLAQDASIDEVLVVLREAERSARRAARGDPTWLALSGGVTSLRIALEADDERVARTGIDVVRTECRRTQ